MIMAGPKDAKGGAKKPAAAASQGKTGGQGPKASRMYEVSGHSVKRKNKTCPKCGAGTFMAHHKDRATCGKCMYTEKHK